MCNEKEERVKREIGALMNMAAPSATYQFKVEFEFLEDYACLNKFSEDLSRCVAVVKPPMYSFTDGRYSELQIQFQEKENRFITKFLNLVMAQPKYHRPRVNVKIIGLNNDMEHIMHTDVYTVTFNSVDMPSFVYKRGDAPEQFVLVNAQVDGHYGDAHKVEFVEKKQYQTDGAILDGQ